ncbi:MAG TPA: XrtA/PEP-CTERM system-associated ATPase [Stellaceae bacterium]|nr:XrtA/PEP-CTERM system-associated ATPase [Stellaceae bacterium]
MYTEFYKFTGLPFQLTPDARFFFGSSGHNKAMAHLTYGLGQGEGFIIITGDIGAGKTTIVEHLLAQLDSRKYLAAKITNTQLGADDTLRMVASAFGIAQEGADKATLLRRFEAFLARIHEQGQRALLVIDECQNLSVPALEELRMLSNLQIKGRTPLQSFLLGQPQFRDTLASEELDQLRQRIIASYHLGPLSEAETRRYIEHRLTTVGWNGDPRLDPGVFAAVHRHAGGVPRKINTLCSRLLLFGFLEERHQLNEADTDEVARDLEQELTRVLSPKANGGARHASAPASAAPPAASPAYEELLSRMSVVESYVRSHDRTIRRVLQIAADYLEGRKL